jgi:hypothetical protein
MMLFGAQAARTILQYGGEERRTSDLFGNKSFLSFTKKTLKGLKVCPSSQIHTRPCWSVGWLSSRTTCVTARRGSPIGCAGRDIPRVKGAVRAIADP